MNSKKLIHHIKEVLYIVIIWILITLFYVFIKFNDIPENYLPEIYGFRSGMSRQRMYEVSLSMALPVGVILGSLHTFLYPYLSRTKSLGLNILIRLSVFLSLSTLILLILTHVYGGNSKFGVYNLPEIFTENAIVSILVYTLLTENLVGLLILLRRNLGERYFINTIINTYRNPKEEERVFMFMDMENSTPIADKMGHLSFSRYIQDCFLDLSDVVLEHDGEIYQFVGDEAVISWKVSGKFNYIKCIDLYFSYMNRLKEKENYYLKKHNNAPVFRSAVHCGKVSAALVGDYKKEIAYHGDVLNLCSRLQTACKENNAYMLASDDFCKRIKNNYNYTLKPVILTKIKGFSNELAVYDINLSNKASHQQNELIKKF